MRELEIFGAQTIDTKNTLIERIVLNQKIYSKPPTINLPFLVFKGELCLVVTNVTCDDFNGLHLFLLDIFLLIISKPFFDHLFVLMTI